MFFWKQKPESDSDDSILNKISLKELSKIPFFYDMEPVEIQALAKILKIRVFPKNHHVFMEGDIQEEMYFILEGTVRILKKNKRGSNDILAEFGPPHVFGELALVSPGRRSASVYSVTDLVLAELSCNKFNKLVESSPKAAVCIIRKIAETLSSRLRKINTAYIELCD